MYIEKISENAPGLAPNTWESMSWKPVHEKRKKIDAQKPVTL
jgi:hypothetical protein